MSSPALTVPEEPATAPAPAPSRRRRRASSVPAVTRPRALSIGVVTLWLSLIVLLPLAAVLAKSLGNGLGGFFDAITSAPALRAIELTLVISLIVTAINAVMGTLIAWVLVRDEFPGKRFINAVIDLPFALPTIVAGIVLLSLYGSRSPVGIDISFTRTAVAVALLFVTLPFVVRSVQPVLIELDREQEQAAASLGASNLTIFRRIVLPSLLPAILSGCGLGFARAVGEFGSVILISGGRADTQVAAIFIYGQIENDAPITAAAVSVALVAIALLILFVFRILGARAIGGHEG